MPRLPDYEGEIWASRVRAMTAPDRVGQASLCEQGFCYEGGLLSDLLTDPTWADRVWADATADLWANPTPVETPSTTAIATREGEETEVTTEELLLAKKCGGDVTKRMIDVMKEANKKCSAFTPANIKILLTEYYDKLTGELDWKKNPPKEVDCNEGCARTLCICGSCMDASVPANIMYGYITAACGVPNVLAKRKAFDLALKNKQQKDPKVRDPRGRSDATSEELGKEFDAIWPPHDQKAVALGYMLGISETADKDSFCGVFGVLKSDLQGPDDPECKTAPCCS